ncbi:hypothetical protein [Desertivirga brevis]|uniref:hypothetical protein n=1 Tax=Desertivirga brevis TaxID=2810310 RepID=UPI001A976178|nr:hypothetical protein [Pedobacter sp. SYSU D00873]
MRNVKVLAIANTVFYVIANVISYLSNTGIFGGRTIGDVSNKYEALFVPAGFTFAIWGVIYASLYAFVIYHLVKAFKEDELHEANKDLKKLGWLFTINNIATAGWVIVWVYEGLIFSVILMLIQLVTLIMMNVRLHIYNPHRSVASRIFTQFPLAIYFAWICIATIANISSSLLGLGFDGGVLSPQTWTVILIAVATLISIFIILGCKDIFFGMVVIWALYGIISKRKLDGAESYPVIVFSAQVAIALIGLAVVFQLARNVKAGKYMLNGNV